MTMKYGLCDFNVLCLCDVTVLSVHASVAVSLRYNFVLTLQHHGHWQQASVGLRLFKHISWLYKSQLDEQHASKEGRLSGLFCAVLCATIVHSAMHTYVQT